MFDVLFDILFLFFLGSCGWVIFSLLRLPIPALLGTVAFVGYFRVTGFSLPLSPDFLSPFIQIVLGLYVGSKVTRDTVRELKAMAPSVAIIVFWALSVVFILGFILSRFTYLDPVTAILSSSMGGLPEMTVIALSTNADIAVIILIQTIRMIGTVVAFPILLNLWMKKNGEKETVDADEQNVYADEQNRKKKRNAAFKLRHILQHMKERPGAASQANLSKQRAYAWISTAGKSVFSLTVAAAGGILLMQLGVPAGAMVGAMFFTAAASLGGAPVLSPSPRVFGFLLVGVGLMVSDNFLPGAFNDLFSISLMVPVIVSTVFIFLSSLLVSFTIHRFVGWDFPTSFLAAAPGGFTVMTALAIKYDKDPFRVSMLHLCRLLAIKSVIPFVFMFFF